LAIKEQLKNWQSSVSWTADPHADSIYSEPEDDFGMPESTAKDLREMLDAIGSDEDPQFTQGTREKHQSLLVKFDPTCL